MHQEGGDAESNVWGELFTDEVVQGLSLYEMNRQPMTRLPDDTEVTMSLRLINSDFRCPVCLGILHSTFATKECLHRFCNECITKSLRLGKRECPSCRVKCPSHRSLRPDESFDALIGTVYPNLESVEASEAKLEEQIKDNQRVLIENLDRGLRRQERLAKSKKTDTDTFGSSLKRKANAEDDDDRSDDSQALAALMSHGSLAMSEPPKKKVIIPSRDMEVEFALISLPTETNQLPQLEKKYIKTTCNCTVQHLYKYLGIKLEGGHHIHDFNIVMSKNKSHIILPPYCSLQFIMDHYWKSRNDLVLFYSLKSATPLPAN